MSATSDPRNPRGARRSQPRDRIGRFTSPTAGPAEDAAPVGRGVPGRVGGDGGTAGGDRPAPRAATAGTGGGDRPAPGAGTAGTAGTARAEGGVRARIAAFGRRAARGALAALRSELARRLGQLAVAGTALGVAVVLLYATGDGPAALARASAAVTSTTAGGKQRPAEQPAVGTTHQPAEKGGSSRSGAGAASPAAPAEPDGSDGSDGSGGSAAAPARQPNQPAAVAAAWYAARNHLPPGKVRALQQDRVGRGEVRVLVLGDRGHGRLDTALVRVRRDASGRWRVP
jgi:hypothetical protein